MKKLTPRERLEIYKKMLVYLKEDREFSLKHGHGLHGFCWALFVCSYDQHYIGDFLELMVIKPQKTFDGFWWTTDPNSTTRIDKIQEIIKCMEKELN